MAYWNHTRQERRIIRQYGGKPLRKYGFDGLLNGRPVEVRSARHDKRYRIQKDVHQTLMKGNGSYILVNPRGRSKVVSARRISKLIGYGKWFKDRDYPHKFLYRHQVF